MTIFLVRNAFELTFPESHGGRIVDYINTETTTSI